MDEYEEKADSSGLSPDGSQTSAESIYLRRAQMDVKPICLDIFAVLDITEVSCRHILLVHLQVSLLIGLRWNWVFVANGYLLHDYLSHYCILIHVSLWQCGQGFIMVELTCYVPTLLSPLTSNSLEYSLQPFEGYSSRL